VKRAPEVKRTDFMQRSSDRHYEGDRAGTVLVWDIDKTYLDTRFSSLRGLLAIPFEFAVDKAAVPGTVPLLRALRHGPGALNAVVPLYFVSGSPPNLRRVLERKMTLDGVQWDGITFKDQFGLLRAGRPRAIKEQIGYKLPALLRYASEVPASSTYLLFGDDVESDMDAFLLFGAVLGGLRGDALRARMGELGSAAPEIERAIALADTLPVRDDPVRRVFIHESRGGRVVAADPRVVVTRSFVQTALVLAHEGHIRPAAVRAVCTDLRLRGVSHESIQSDIDDAHTRLHIPHDVIAHAGR
jgi:hypothetical protein